MKNCFLEDADFITTVRPLSFIKEDFIGSFIDIRVNQNDVVKLMKIGLIPRYIKDIDCFSIRVGINKKTIIHINGVRTIKLDGERLKLVPVSKVSIRELAIKRYSNETDHKHRDCYATKIIFYIPISYRSK